MNINKEKFVRQLCQAIEWTSYLSRDFDTENGNYGMVFRGLNPIVNGVEAFDLNYGCASWIIDYSDPDNYVILLDAILSIRSPWGITFKDIDLAGRILCFETCISTADGAPIAESNCFFDKTDVPPIDTWFYLEEVPFADKYPILYCWIPKKFEPVVQSGIDVEILVSYKWFDQIDPLLNTQIFRTLQMRG